METSKNNKIYVLGSTKAVTECLDIILYNKSNFNRKISLYNLEDFYKEFLSGSDTETHLRLSRSSKDENFFYKGTLEEGFDVIVYISPFSNIPSGYTEFVNVQGRSGDIKISIDVKRNLETLLGDDDQLKFSIELKLENNISKNNLNKDYLGEELYNYVSSSEVLKDSYSNLYTNDIGRSGSDPRSLIYSSSSGVINNSVFWKFRINKNINIDPYSKTYNRFKVCYYNNDLVIACWKEESKSYSLYSLINKNTLGFPFVKHGETTESILKICGRFYIDADKKLRYLDSNKEVGDNSLVCDGQDNRGIVYDLPEFYLKSDIIKYIPELNNIYLDLDYYLRSNQLSVYDKIGSWFILKQKYGGDLIYLAVSPVSVIYMSKEDLDKSFFVNDQTVILAEEDYYAVYDSMNTKLYTERARNIIHSRGNFEIYDDSGIYMCVLGTEEDEKHYLEYYDSDLVNIVFKYEDLYSTVLNKYRRNYYPSNIKGIPEIIDSFKGLIFYKSDNIITYL